MRNWAGSLAIAFACAPVCAWAQPAPTPPPSGFSLGVTLGPGWSSNPEDLPGPSKGDAYFGAELVASYRWALWQGGALTISGTGYSELYARASAGGVNRVGSAATFSQQWQGTSFTLGVSARTSMNQHLTRHDGASQEISLGVSRPIPLAPDITLILSAGASRRFYQDGTEDQMRARVGATLARKWERWTFRIGGGFGYALEDKTPILPRINDRTLSANIGASYEWEKNREISLKLAYSRTYSSYSENRTKAFTIVPQVSATIRF